MREKQKAELTFKVTNLGAIAEGKFTQKPLTIFCGPNNSGKTWAMYSLYHFYNTYERIQSRNDRAKKANSDRWKDVKARNESVEKDIVAVKKDLEAVNEGVKKDIDVIKKDIEAIQKSIYAIEGVEKDIEVAESIENLNRKMNSTLIDAFNATPESINNAKFNLQSSVSWKQLEQEIRDKAFLVPAERSGLQLFFSELSSRRASLLHNAPENKIGLRKLLRNVTRSRYAKPIADYIDWLNDLKNSSQLKSNSFHSFGLHLQKEIAGGVYEINRLTTDITFNPKNPDKDRKNPPPLRLHLTSSAVKSLFGLWFYLEHLAEKGDVFMIDEPELNLHPENQRKIARLIAQLVNAGLKVVISTHSDYIIRELNTLIMLSSPDATTLRKKHKYKDDEVLTPEKIGAYHFDKGDIKPFEISSKDGIYASTFDDVIKDLNKTNDDIYYALRDLENEH